MAEDGSLSTRGRAEGRARSTGLARADAGRRRDSRL